MTTSTAALYAHARCYRAPIFNPSLHYIYFCFQFVGVEGFITAIIDLFPNQLRKGYNREYFAAGYCFISFLIGCSMVSYVGIFSKDFVGGKGSGRGGEGTGLTKGVESNKG